MHGLILICFLLDPSGGVPVQRCCESGSSLHLSSPPSCRPTGGPGPAARPLPGVAGLDLTKEGDGRNVEVGVEEAGRRTPACPGELQAHRLGSEGWLTTAGELVTARYEAEFPHGEFCLDYEDSSSTVAAVMCDPCSGVERPCLSLCCPHGHALLLGPDGAETCQERPGGASFSPEAWGPGDQRLLQWERNRHYVLVAPPGPAQGGTNLSEGFTCPSLGSGPLDQTRLVRLWAEQAEGEYHLQQDGSLQGRHLPDYSSMSEEGGLATKDETWPAGHFCLVLGTPPDYDNYDYGSEAGEEGGAGEVELSETYMTCFDTDPYHACTAFTNTFHPTALIISITFLLLTLACYGLVPALRDHLVGRATVLFLANLALCFIVSVLTWFKVAGPDSTGCVLSGYLIQYFFLAFFFWLNTLAIHIYLPFSTLGGPLHRASEAAKLGLGCLYAQGLPLLICSITALVDSTGPAGQAERLARPNIGVFRCFLGAQHTSPARSFFVHPDFIYFHSVVLLLQVSNLALLIGSIAHFCSAGPESALRQSRKDNVIRFVKFFVILGFYWTGDLLSAALSVEYGPKDTCWVRVIADLGGLFSGVLIFLVLICNRKVLASLRERLGGRRSASREEEELEETRMLPGDSAAPAGRVVTVRGNLSSSG